MARDILAELGLSKDKVARALAHSEKKILPKPKVIEEFKPHSELCRFGDDLKNSIARVRANESWMITEFLNGRSPEDIALLIGVSAETVRKRIRLSGFFGKRKRGKPVAGSIPVNSPPPQASQRIYRVEPTDCNCP